MHIVYDTREQKPFLFEGYPCFVTPETLHTGDYSILGLYGKVIIERKSLSDLAGCMTHGRDRFERELDRMRDFDAACVVVESPITDIRSGKYRSKLDPNSFEQSILSFMFRYRVPFFFGHTREHAEWLAFNCLRHYWNKNKCGRQVPYFPMPKNKVTAK